MRFSLIVTHDSSPVSTSAEILDALLPLDPQAQVLRTRHRGVLVVDTNLDPIDATKAISAYLPATINRIVPVLKVTGASLSEVIDSTLEALRGMKPMRSFAVRATVRGNNLSKSLIENDLGAAIKAQLGTKVDLRNPEQLVLIEIIDEIACISVVDEGCPIHVRRMVGNYMEGDYSPTS